MQQQQFVVFLLFSVSISLYSADEKNKPNTQKGLLKKSANQQSPSTLSPFSIERIRSHCRACQDNSTACISPNLIYGQCINTENMSTLEIQTLDKTLSDFECHYQSLNPVYDETIRQLPIEIKKIIVNQRRGFDDHLHGITHRIQAPHFLIRYSISTGNKNDFQDIVKRDCFLKNKAIQAYCRQNPSVQKIYDEIKNWDDFALLFYDGMRSEVDAYEEKLIRGSNSKTIPSKGKKTSHRYTSEQLTKLHDRAKQTTLPAAIAQTIRALGVHRDQPLRKW